MEIDISFFKELVQIPSESWNIPEVNRAEDRMQDYLQSHGISCVMEEMVDGRKVLYATTVPGEEPDFLFNAHLDVVPAPKSIYQPRTEGEWLYARGAEDCKGNCMALVHALLALKGKASVGVIFTADEEIGGDSTRAMVERGYKAKKLIIISDSGPYVISIAEKGMLNLMLKARGIAAHSSRPWAGKNAIDALIDGYFKLRKAWPQNEPGSEVDSWFDTMSADIISGGTAANKVPDEAELLINIRYTKCGDIERIEQFVKDVTGLEVERGENCLPVYCDEKDPILQKLLETMKQKWPTQGVHFNRMCGATDARHFVGLGIPIAIIGVQGCDCHGLGEGVSMKHIGETADMLVDFVLNAQ